MQQLSNATKEPELAFSCAEALLDTVPTVMRSVRARMRRHRGAGLSVPQFRTLVLLHRSPELTLSAVAEHLGLSTSGTSRLVDGLVDKGLVVRASGAGDRRRLSLSLSSAGRDSYRRARQATRAELAFSLSRLSAPELRAVRDAMALLRDCFGDAASAPARVGGEPK